MEIIAYTKDYAQQVIDLILHIQNDEAQIELTLVEQPDLLDIETYYFGNGGRFWLAVEDGTLIGTIALMNNSMETVC